MIELNLKLNNKEFILKLREEIVFDALLYDKDNVIKKIITDIKDNYRISETFFDIVNKFVDFDAKGNSIYCGLIVRTDRYKFSVIYLEKTKINEEYLLKIIKDYLYDIGEVKNTEIFIDKFEVERKQFLKYLKNLE